MAILDLKKKKTSHFLSETVSIIGQNFGGPRILNVCVVVELWDSDRDQRDVLLEMLIGCGYLILITYIFADQDLMGL